MDNSIVRKISKSKATKASVLTFILLLSLSLPILMLPAVSAAGTVSISPTSGPNGTAVRVTGSGFGASESVGAFTVLVDGIGGKTTTGAPINANNRLATSATGVIQGAGTTPTVPQSAYIIIGGAGGLLLSPGTHSVQIFDATAAPLAVSFTITIPTVTVTPSTGPAGTSVVVTGAGFTQGVSGGVYTVTNTVTAATFAGTALVVSGGSVTGSATTLSSNVISNGAYTGTVSLPALTAGTSFTLTDSFGNIATTTWALNAPTITLSPTSGPIGTVVTATVTGMGPGATFSQVKIGNGATQSIISTLAPVAPVVTEQGTSVFLFTAQFTWATAAVVAMPVLNTGTATAAAGATFALSTAAILSTTLSTVVQAGTVTPSANWATAGTVSGTFTPVETPTGTVTASFTGTVGAPDVGTVNAITVVVTVTGSVDFTNGAHTITVVDSKGNTASSSFSITPKVTMTLGAGGVNSGEAYAPQNTAAVTTFLTVSGFKPNTPLTFVPSAGIPTGWITFTALAVTTDSNGAIGTTAVSSTGTSPAFGQYTIAVSDGVTSVTVFLQITNSLNFFVISPVSGAQGTTVTLTGFGASTTAIMFDGATVGGATQCAANAWPAVPTTYGSFTVPSSGAGTHQVTTTGIAGSMPFTNTGTPVAVVSPNPAAVGTTATVVVTGVANNAANALLSVTMDGILTTATSTIIGSNIIATFTVPNFPAAAHAISVTDNFFNTAASTLTNTLSSITLSRTSGAISTGPALSLSITGSGFPMTSAITTLFDGGALAMGAPTVGCTQTNTNGGILIYTLTYPVSAATPAGAHTISVAAGAATAIATFTVLPSASIAPTALRAPGTTAITGTDFSATSALTLLVNGTVGSWFNTATTLNTTTITSTAAGAVPASAAYVVPAGTAPGALNLTVVDAAGFAVSNTLTVLGTPAITLAAAQGVSGQPATVGISGSGFTPGSRVATVNFISTDGMTVLFTGIQTTSPMTVGGSGTFQSSAQAFTVPTVAAGTYTISLTLTVPTESANATFKILGVPTVSVSPATGIIGTNVTVTVIGLAPPAVAGPPTTYPITTALLGSTNLIPALTTGGGVNVPATGTNAFNLTTWFLIPAGIPAGQYTVLVGDGTRSATTQLNVTPSVTLTPNTGLKGSTTVISGNGFAPTSVVSVKFNGVAVTTTPAAQTTDASGQLVTAVNTVTITIPITAVAVNTVTVTDAIGNSVTAQYNVTAPALLVTPSSGGVGTTVQLIGSGFTGSSQIVVQVGTAVVVTAPIGITGDSFLAYIQIPAGTPAGQTVITATDAKNNMAIANYTVGGGGTGGSFAVDSTALSTSAQTLGAGGSAQTTFARGTSVKVQFVLQTTTGSGNVVWRVTFQKADLTATVISSSAGVTTSPATMFTQIPLSSSDPAGTWTAQIQIYASDGVTALAVKTLTFTVT